MGHLGGVFDKQLAGVLLTLNSKQTRGAEVLFKSLAVLDGNFKLVPAARPWAPLETVAEMAQADAVALRDCLASAGLIDLWRAPSAPLSGLPPATEVQVALVRANPLVYFGGGEAVPDFRFVLWRSQFSTYLNHWLSSGQSAGALLTGNALNEAEGWLGTHVNELTEPERLLIDASNAARHKQLEEEELRRHAERSALAAQAARMKTRALQMFGATIGALALLVLAGYLGWRAYTEGRAANGLRLAAESGAMFAGARPGGDERAMLQILAAHRMAPNAVVYAGLLDAAVAKRDLLKVWPVGSAVFSIAVEPRRHAHRFGQSGQHAATVGHQDRSTDRRTAQGA